MRSGGPVGRTGFHPVGLAAARSFQVGSGRGQEGNEMEAWILIGVALLYALITLAGYLDRRDVRRDEQQRLRGLGWNPPTSWLS